MIEFIVGIPICNEPVEILQGTMYEVQHSEARPSRVILIDNSDDDRLIGLGRPSVDELAWFIEQGQHERLRVDVVRPQRNLGCAGAWNLIHLLCGSTTAIVLNADCAVAPDTFARMLSVPGPAAVFAYAYGCFRIDQDIRRIVGQFDEEFYPAYLEDADYRHRLRLAGVSVEEWPLDRQVPVGPGRERSADGIEHGKHDPSGYQGWRGERLARFHECVARNRARYLKKWGGEPNQEKFSRPFDGEGVRALDEDSGDEPTGGRP